MTYSEHQLDELASISTIDITTTGRKSGRRRRIEIWWFRVGARFIITGTPGRRDWLANLRADPRLTVHVNGVDIEATATEVDDKDLRRAIFTAGDTDWFKTQAELDRLVAEAPMIEVHF